MFCEREQAVSEVLIVTVTAILLAYVQGLVILVDTKNWERPLVTL